MKSDFGVLTLATLKDYRKAIALAVTIKEHSPEIPISVVCSKKIKLKLVDYFDQVIIEKSSLKGFEHKLYLDEYSPYKNTFFFDSDILIIKDIREVASRWKGSGYAVTGKQLSGGISSFGLKRNKVLQMYNKKLFSVIDGAGHAYFEKPQCFQVFEKAREIMADYHIYNANHFADEDAIGIALTILGIVPKVNDGVLGSPWHAINNSFNINSDISLCRYLDLEKGVVEPYFVHFPRYSSPFIYAREMKKSFKRQKIKVNGVYYFALKEIFKINIIWPLIVIKKKILNRV